MTPFPKITLPDVDPEGRALVEAAVETERSLHEHTRTQQRGMARAMVALGKPVFRSAPSKRRKGK